MERVSSSDFTQWEMLEQIEPFGERAHYLRTAMLCALLVNINRVEGQPAAEIDAFMPSTMRVEKVAPENLAGSEDEEMASPEAVRAIMFAFMEKQNAWYSQQTTGNA